MFRAVLAGAFALGLLAPSHALAQLVDSSLLANLLPIEGRLITTSLPALLRDAALAPQIQLSAPAPLAPEQLTFAPETRPSWIMPMHVVTALMQGLDAHSTFAALEAGAVESNPIVAGLSPDLFLATKVGVAAGLIYATDKIARKNPTHAFVLALVINSAYAMMVAHNYRVAAR